MGNASCYFHSHLSIPMCTIIKISLPKIYKNNNKIDIKICMFRNTTFIFHLRSYLSELDTIKVCILCFSPQNSLLVVVHLAENLWCIWTCDFTFAYDLSSEVLWIIDWITPKFYINKGIFEYGIGIWYSNDDIWLLPPI